MVKTKSGRVMRKKLLRDMKSGAMQFIAMILLCFLGTWVFSGLDGTWRLMDKTVETYFEECNLADLWVNASTLGRQELTRLKHISGVSQIQPRTSLTVDTPELGSGVQVALECYEGAMEINKPYLCSGELLDSSDVRGCLVEEQFAQAHGLEPGDSLTLRVSGQDISFVIRGLVMSAEYTITSKDVRPDPEHYGFVMISSQAVPALPYTNVLVTLEEDAEEAGVIAAIEDAIPSALVITQKTQKTVSTARSYAQMFHGLSYLFPLLAFAVAAMIVVSTLTRMIAKERTQIGTLKSLGYGDRQIWHLYRWYAIIPSVIGSLIGLVVGRYTLPDVLWAMVTHNSRYPYMLRADISLPAWLITGFCVLLSLGICRLTFRKTIRECTANLLRPKPPRSGTRILLERWKSLWSRLSFNSKMIIRNLMRNKGRTTIMLVGIICCNMLIICTFGLQESISYFIGQYYGGTLTYELRVDLDTTKSGTLESYQNRLEAGVVEGVMEKSVSLRGSKEERACPLTVLKADQTIYHLTADQQIMTLPEEGAVISRKLAQVMGISLGETVSIILPGDTEAVSLVIRDFADTNVGQGLFMSEEAWSRLRKGDFSVTALLIRDASDSCLHQLDEMEEADTVKYLSDQYSQTMTILDATATAFSILSAAALGLAFVICYNMGLLNFTERIRDYATLKVLGYHQKEIRSLMLRESSLTGLLGTLLGIPPGILLVGVILKLCEYDSMVFVSYVSPLSVLKASVITFAFTLCIEWVLTRKVRGIDMVEALKSVE